MKNTRVFSARSLLEVLKQQYIFFFFPPRNLSLHDPDKGLNELNERLLAFVAHLGAWRGWFGLGGGEDAASRRRRRAPAEVARQAREKGALEAEKRGQLLVTTVIMMCRVAVNKYSKKSQ